jgi:hypothetical protein
VIIVYCLPRHTCWKVTEENGVSITCDAAGTAKDVAALMKVCKVARNEV